MSAKTRKQNRCRIRFYISILISLGLAALLLWGLVSIHDPQAKLYKLNLRNVNKNYSTIYLELELKNQNYFQGFNYTDNGWIELFYVTDNRNQSWELQWDYTPAEYQGFRKSLRWNFTMNISTRKLDWPTYSPLLKNKDSHIYVSLYLTYWYKILLWTTKTNNYQWLDIDAYVTNSFDLNEVSMFDQTTNFTLAIST